MDTQSPSLARPRRPRWVTVALIIALGLAGALAIDIYKTATAKDLVPWRTDMEAAIDEAAAADRPVLLYFTAAWCGPCQQMRRYVYSDQDVARGIADAAMPIKVDLTDPQPGDLGLDVAMQLQIEGFPTLVLLDPGQGERSRKVGYVGAEELLAWLNG